jgi:hypothetical protein
MKMIVISDTHHDFYALRKILPVINSCDYLVHLGDCNDDIDKIRGEITTKNVICVRGNCDYVTKYPIFSVVEIENAKFFFTHGHAYRVDDDLIDLTFAAEETGCKYAFYGHTHIAATDYYRGVTIINPGSLSRPRAGGASYCIVEGSNGNFFTNIILTA